MHIAVLGGGLTGLSSAFHLSRRFPDAVITLLERKPRLGGWVQSERVSLPDAELVVEGGPRTLRPNAPAVLELINLLRLQHQLITVPRDAPAAKNRFLYFNGLTPIPTSLFAFLKSPLTSILLSSILREPFRRPNRPHGIQDESLDSFLSRRFSPEFARIFGSALVHGIYAADSRQLSVRSAFSVLWDAEERGKGSLLRGMFLSKKSLDTEAYDLGTVPDLLKDTSVFSFKGGMNTLTDAMVQSLSNNPNVKLLLDTPVTSLNPSIELTTPNESLHPTHIVSTLPLPILSTLLPTPLSLPHLTSSVTVYNLIFPLPPSQIHPPGFGYLVPRPDSDAGILGTVFDSSSLSAQDSDDAGAKYTKLTVMSSAPPMDVKCILALLSRHLALGRDLPEPAWVKVRRHEDCIPVPTPGHLVRMRELKDQLDGGEWKGRLKVLGAGVGGVSVGDCVKMGREAGIGW